MKKKLTLLTSRTWNNYFPLQVVYEWEDVIAKELQLPLDGYSQVEVNERVSKRIPQLAQKVIRRTILRNHIDLSFNFFSRQGNEYLSFLLYPSPIQNHYIYQHNFIPILLDCFEDIIRKVPHYFKKNKLLFVTNMEVYNRLQETTIKDKVKFVSLSISDKYYSETVPEKTVDVIQVGRQNPVLHSWMLRVIERHPQIEYVYARLDKDKHQYYSSRRGALGDLDTREAFMNFIGSAKIALLSSPGTDGGEKRTGGFNPVTPRFYEAAVKYCYIVGRYPEHASDFIHNGVSEVAINPSSFEEFEATILTMVSTPFNQKEGYDKFIQQHLTSTIARSIQVELQKL